MSLQGFLAGALGLAALWFVMRVFLRQFGKTGSNETCEDCPVHPHEKR